MMVKQLIITMSFDGQPEIQCMPLDNCSPGLGLSDAGMTWREHSEALLYIDDHNELMIKSEGKAHIEIERLGRRQVMIPGHPMRILAGDIIRIGDTNPHVFEIRHIYCTPKKFHQLSRLSKMAMIACATSMVMTCSIACNRPAPKTPANAVQTSESQTSSEQTQEEELTETDIQLMMPNQTAGIGASSQNQLEALIKNKEEFVEEMKSNADE